MREVKKTLERAPAILSSGDAESCEQLLFASLRVGDRDTTAKTLAKLRKLFPVSSRVDRDEAVALQVEEDQLQELLRDGLLVGDLGDENRLFRLRLRQIEQGAHGVFGFLGEHYR